MTQRNMKQKRQIFSILFFIVILTVVYWANKRGNTGQIAPSSTVSFEASMGAPDHWEYVLMMSNQDNERSFRKYEKVYYDHIHSKKASQGIPKIIHHIWLGPNKPPSYFEEYLRSWRVKHPEWEFKLWTDKEVEHFKMDLREEFDSSLNWGEKSDILRAEILDKIGGLYVDVDFECLKSFDLIGKQYDFFAGIEPPHEGVHPKSFPRVTVSNALIGVCPGHPIIKKWKKLIKDKWLVIEEQLADGKKRVLERTFNTFGSAVFSHVDDPLFCNIVFPSTYFYPLTFSELAAGKKKKKNVMKRTFQSILYWCHLRRKPAFSEIKPETMAVHYWGGSWIKTADELLADLQFRIDYLENIIGNEVVYLRKENELLRAGKPLQARDVCLLKNDQEDVN